MYCYVALKRLVFVVFLSVYKAYWSYPFSKVDNFIFFIFAILQLPHIHDTCKQNNQPARQCKQ